jgi:hypothetical protein
MFFKINIYLVICFQPIYIFVVRKASGHGLYRNKGLYSSKVRDHGLFALTNCSCAPLRAFGAERLQPCDNVAETRQDEQIFYPVT